MEAIPIAGPVIGGLLGSKATGDAADQQVEAARESSAAQERMMERNLDFQRWVYEQQRADNSQSRQVGDAARNQLAFRMGLDPASFSTPSVPYPTAPTPQNPQTPQAPAGGGGYSDYPTGPPGWNAGWAPGGAYGDPYARTSVAKTSTAKSTQTTGGSEWNREFERLNNIPPQLKAEQTGLTQYYKEISGNSPGQYQIPSQQPQGGTTQPQGGTTQPQGGTTQPQNALTQYRQGLRDNPTAGNPSTVQPVNSLNTNAPPATTPGGTPTQNPGVYVDANGNYAWSDTAGGTTPAAPASPATDQYGNPREGVTGQPPLPQAGGNALNPSQPYKSNYDPSFDYDPNSMGGLNAAYGEQAPDIVTQPYSSQPGALQAPNMVLKPFSEEDFRADPGYQFRLSEGNKGIERSAAAAGGQLSGATMKALARFNQGTADQAYGDAYNRYNQDQGTVYNQANQNYTNAYNRYNLDQNQIYDQANANYTNRFNRFNQNQGTQFNRLSALAGGGQVATQANNAAAQNLGASANSAFTNTGNQVSQNIIGAGNARSAGTIGGANAWSTGINTGINNYMQQNALNKASGSGYNINLFPDFGR